MSCRIWKKTFEDKRVFFISHAILFASVFRCISNSKLEESYNLTLLEGLKRLRDKNFEESANKRRLEGKLMKILTEIEEEKVIGDENEASE